MIVVTGGAGFIGSNIIKALNQLEYKNILVVDHLRNGKKIVNLVNLDIIDFIDKKDFIRLVKIDNVFKNIKVIFHMGACSSTNVWDGKYIMKNNYEYSKELLHFCLKFSIPFIYSSSASVYGNRMQNFIEHRYNEFPLTVYGYSKFLFDQYVRSVLPQVKSPVCGLRYFNVYGPGESHKGNMASIVYRCSKQIFHNENPILFVGSNNFKRDFVYIDDVVLVNIWMWKQRLSGIFNCGTGCSESFESIVDIIIKFYNRGVIKYIAFPEKLKKYYQTFTKANITKLRNAGYERKFKNVAQGIREYLEWLVLHH